MLSSTPYYFENFRRFAQPDFYPNNEDIIHAKLRTTGIHEIEFEVDNRQFLLVDVGGQVIIIFIFAMRTPILSLVPGFLSEAFLIALAPRPLSSFTSSSFLIDLTQNHRKRSGGSGSTSLKMSRWSFIW
jgi:hypothetical protein